MKAVERSFKELTSFFQGIGAADLDHTETTYLAHAIRVYQDLKKWGCNEEVCRAGMFHSIYGTEKFQRFTFPLERRGEIRELIGADSLGYLSLNGLRHCGETLKHGSCDACFSNEYPVAIGDEEPRPQLSLFRSVEAEDD